MRRFIVALALVVCLPVGSAQENAKPVTPPPAFFQFMLQLQKHPTSVPVSGAESKTVRPGKVTLRGPAKFVKAPKAFDDFWIVALAAGDDAKVVTDNTEWLPLFFPYADGAPAPAVSAADSFENIFENGKYVGRTYSKPSSAAGYLVAAKKGSADYFMPGEFWGSVYDVEGENPANAPTLAEKSIVADGVAIYVEEPAKFMKLPETLSAYWAVPVPAGDKGRVAVDSTRWKVAFLPFENGGSARNVPVELQGEPISKDGKAIRWIYKKPSDVPGWFVPTQLVPEKR